MLTKSRTVLIERLGILLYAMYLRTLAAMFFVVMLSGCAGVVNHISDDISGWVSSPFLWSSDLVRSSSREIRNAYRGDIRSYVAVSSHSNSDVEEIQSGLAAIGEKHGITDWEADMVTYTGIGEGLAQAKESQQKVDDYKSCLAQGDYAKSVAIQKGYELGL
jgi:hypothetical protein